MLILEKEHKTNVLDVGKGIDNLRRVGRIAINTLVKRSISSY